MSFNDRTLDWFQYWNMLIIIDGMEFHTNPRWGMDLYSGMRKIKDCGVDMTIRLGDE